MSIVAKTNLKKIVLTILAIASIPLIGIIAKVIFAYGTYVGTYARTLIEAGICK